MTTIETMYAPQVNSPATTLSANISSSATSISVLSGATLPAAPNLLVIGGDTENAETVRMTAKSGNTITVVRGVQGTARAWNTGALIARLFTAKDLSDVQTNITALNSGKAEQTDLAAAEDRIDDVYASSASGPIASYYRTVGGLPVDNLTIDINPVQAGSGDPSPTNVRALSGRAQASVTKTGHNICPLAVIGNSYNANTGVSTTDNTSAATPKFRVDFSKYTSYHLHNLSSVNMQIFGWDENGNFVARTGGNGNSEYTFNHTSFTNTGTTGTGDLTSIVFIAVRFYQSTGQDINNVTGAKIQIEPGDVFTTYEPYAGITKSISFGQTVYGGTLNVTTGVLTVTHGRVDMGTLSWTYVASGTYFAATVTDKAIGNMNLLADCYKTTTALNTASMANNEIKGRATGHEIYLKDSRYTDKASLETALSGHYLVYELDEPLTYQLTPEQIYSLLGENNVWADTGDVYVTFGADIKTYVDNRVGGKQDKIFASGILKGNGSGTVSAAVAGTDYQAPLTAGTDYQTPLDEKALQWYGVCSTSASTQAKTVSITGITSLTTGLEIRVKMTNAQTYNGTPTLNVNSLGAKTIKQHGSTDAVRYQWQAGEVISFTYDGTYWVIENNSLATTTYFGLTRLSSATNSTAEDCAATPKAVKTAYDLADAAIPATEKGTSVATLATAADSTTPSVPRITPAQSFAPIFDITADTTLAAKHAGGILKCTNSPTITIPSNVFAEATQIEILNYGTGVVTVQGASGCSLNGTSAGSKQITDQYSSGVLLAISASQWVIQGAIS